MEKKRRKLSIIVQSSDKNKVNDLALDITVFKINCSLFSRQRLLVYYMRENVKFLSTFFPPQSFLVPIVARAPTDTMYTNLLS